MEARPLGRTGLVTSRLGLGLAALGRPGYINLGHAADLAGETSVGAMRARAHDVLDCAYAVGIRYFDAARSYGRAEEFLGDWLDRRAIQAESAVVGSKWGYTYTAGWRTDAELHEVKEHTLAVFERQLDETRALLGRRLRLYQIHSATLESGVLDRKDVLSALARLRDSGMRVGLTVTGAGQSDTLRRAREVECDGRPLFDVVQATWNLLERSAGGALAEAAQDGLGIIVKEGLANGRLTVRNRSPGFAAKRAVLERIASAHGVGIDAVALGAILAEPWVDVVLSGAATAAQLRSNAAAAVIRLQPDERSELGSLSEPQSEYWGERARLPWN